MKKKYLIGLISIVLAFNLFAEQLKVTEDANLRELPNKDSNVITVLKAGTIGVGELSNENENWYKIKVDNTTGFIHKSLVIVSSDSDDSESSNKPRNTNVKTEKGFFGFIKKHPYLILILLAFIIYVIISRGINTRCSQCKKWFAIIPLNEEYLDSDGHYETVTRTDIRKNKKGEQIGTVERKEQIHMTTDHYLQHCKCKYCGYEYSYETSKTYEG